MTTARDLPTRLSSRPPTPDPASVRARRLVREPFTAATWRRTA